MLLAVKIGFEILIYCEWNGADRMLLGCEVVGLLLFAGLTLLPGIPVLVFAARFFLRKEPCAKRPMVIAFATIRR